MRQFIDISQIYTSNLDSKNYFIERKTMTQTELDFWKNNPDTGMIEFANSIQLGKEYVVLYHKQTCCPMMSNLETEIATNQKFIDNAKGDVLIFGLGLGLIIFPLLDDDSITSIDVVEIDSDLIQTVLPIIKSKDTQNKLKVINSDMSVFHTFQNHRLYDTIYFDIWFNPLQAEEEAQWFYDLYKSWQKPNAYVDVWTNKTTIHKFV